MNETTGLPSWHQHHNQVYTVTANCVLEWPDCVNCREFPRMCPIHGIWSRWNVDLGGELCSCNALPHSQSTIPATKENAQSNVTIAEVLQRIYDGEYDVIFNGSNGSGVMDSLDNRLALFKGAQLGLVPKEPVVVNSHSLRAVSNPIEKQISDCNQYELGYVYAYLRDLKFCKEWCDLLRNQIRHNMPSGFNVHESYKEVMVYRRPKYAGLMVNIFPDVKCFITYINYNHFAVRPDIHYGDQILEFNHCILQHSFTNLSRSALQDDVFRLRVRPCPFLKTLTLSIGSCPIADESSYVRNRKNFIRSYRDLGFSVYKGCITTVAFNSPAQKAGLKPNYKIVEVNGHFVVKHTDAQILSMMRHFIYESPTRSVDLVVMPERLHSQLQSVDNIYHVSTNRGFNLNSWINAEAFGFCKSNGYI